LHFGNIASITQDTRSMAFYALLGAHKAISGDHNKFAAPFSFQVIPENNLEGLANSLGLRPETLLPLSVTILRLLFNSHYVILQLCTAPCNRLSQISNLCLNCSHLARHDTAAAQPTGGCSSQPSGGTLRFRVEGSRPSP
jgi:hypothetical protein